MRLERQFSQGSGACANSRFAFANQTLSCRIQVIQSWPENKRSQRSRILLASQDYFRHRKKAPLQLHRSIPVKFPSGYLEKTTVVIQTFQPSRRVILLLKPVLP
jgi:hypothetical protein